MENKPRINVSALIGAIVGAVLFLIVLNVNPGATAQGFVQTSNAVQIPQALILAVEGLLFALVTAGFLFIYKHTGLDLGGIATPLAGTLAGFLLGLAQQWIDLQPVTSDPYILMALNVLVVIIGGLPLLQWIVKKLM